MTTLLPAAVVGPLAILEVLPAEIQRAERERVRRRVVVRAHGVCARRRDLAQPVDQQMMRDPCHLYRSAFVRRPSLCAAVC
jgi:hypothetical protein